jgi:hypothetical protein
MAAISGMTPTESHGHVLLPCKGNQITIDPTETQMKIRNPDLRREDWEFCRTYVKEMELKGLSACEPWELELEAWAANPDRQPRKSTVIKLRLRFPLSH